uniref:AB hydrolase-1 domain-containing protein n=2 Tax=Chrysotila carterae TaxID=13221 RepID=A0A7S4B514_CHRCT
MMSGGKGEARVLPGDMCVREHVLKVPLDHGDASGKTIELFVREVVRASKSEDEALPYLLYLQGGPGFPSGRPSAPPGGWMKAALNKYRVLLLDQRGTGRSTPVTSESLSAIGSAEEQAAYLSHFRADAIVRDCEAVRASVARARKLTLLGQSFGGFCILSYLSIAPEGVERALFTFGLAPVGVAVDDVYHATFKRMEARNARFYARYPEDVELVREIVSRLHREPVPLPRGGTLTARRFLQLGLLLGSASGFESLHDLLELARAPGGPAPLPQHFLLAVEQAQQGFETNPIYWLLHEAIYCDGDGSASAWAAERVQASLGDAWDYTTRLDLDGPPVQLTGEMVYSWMGEDYAWLRPLAAAADILAHKTDWGHIYSRKALNDGSVPCAALVSYDDIYVERAFSEQTASMIGGGCRMWITNEFQHSGLRDDPSVFDKLVAMSKGEVEY